jgi:hypothetical protein
MLVYSVGSPSSPALQHALDAVHGVLGVCAAASPQQRADSGAVGGALSLPGAAHLLARLAAALVADFNDKASVGHAVAGHWAVQQVSIDGFSMQ